MLKSNHFTILQKTILEIKLSKNRYISKISKAQLAITLNLSEQQVRIWFQNRRTKSLKRFSKMPKPIENQEQPIEVPKPIEDQEQPLDLTVKKP